MDRFLHTLVEAASRTGHHVLLFSGDPDDPLDGYDDLLRATAVDAFIVTDTYAGTPQSGFLQDRGAPFVAFGRPWDDPTADHAWIDVDGAHGARIATEHLLEQGHERIAWLGWEKSSRIGQDRRSGWETAMRAARREVMGLGVRLTDNVDAARMAAHHLLEDPTVTGFVCASDTLGIGVLHACAERGLRPGTDIGVVGFDDSLAAQVTWPGLTSVRQPLEQVAEELVQILHLVLGHKPLAERGRMLLPTARRTPLQHASVAAAPHDHGVVDRRALVLREHLVGHVAGELDADDRLEVLAPVEGPGHRHGVRLPALRRPEGRRSPRGRARRTRAAASAPKVERVGRCRSRTRVPPGRTTRSSSARPGSQPGPKK